MAYFERVLKLSSLLEQKSFFLFGARSTGKTTLIEHQLRDAHFFDLLDGDTFRTIIRNPKIIEQRVANSSRVVVIDEIQKAPALLDEVQRLIRTRGYTFLLTGSSARKLKRGGANLLAGRAWTAELYPLVSAEIPDLDLNKYLNHGGLPQVYPSKAPHEELRSYVGTYLKEEIQAEAVTRNVQAFAEFLDLIALSNGQEINYESLASDCQVSPSTMKSYIQILEDTLLGFSLPGFRKSKKRKAISRAKHYLFDIGVTNELCKRGVITPKSELFGNAFEHFIVLELRAYLSYRRRDEVLSYWRTTSQFEVDVLVGTTHAIECKATDSVHERHLKGIRALREEKIFKRYHVVSLDPEKRILDDGTEIWPWHIFLSALWSDQIL